jgi:putative hydrolase of the HAD superfamily
MIRTIISDLGKVLLDFDHMHSCRRLAEQCQWTPEYIYESMFKSGLEKEYDLGLITSEEFGRRIIDQLNLNLDVGAIRPIWADIFNPIDGMEKLIASLKGAHKLVLLSNTNEWHFEHCLKTFPVVGFFDAFALSYRLGCRKPDRDIYRRALGLAGSAPEETIFIDDVPAYIEAAEALGIEGIRFENVAQLEKELVSAGVSMS